MLIIDYIHIYIPIFTYAQRPRARSGSIRLALCKKEVKYDILLVAPSANINILDLPPLAGQFYLRSVGRSILPLVSQSCLTLFLTVARGCEIGTRATCVRVAKVGRLPQS